MKYAVVPTISDAVNRKSMRVDPGALYDSVRKDYADGMPFTIGHDRHRPIGWVRPAALYLEPGLNRVLAHRYTAETVEEIRSLTPQWKNFIATTVHGVPQTSVTRLKELIGEDKLSGKEVPWDTGVEALRGKGLAERAFPAVFQMMDKDGLVPFSGLEMIRPGVFRFGELCLFAHHYMRRSESPINHFNEELFATLHQMNKDTNVSVRVRLDPDMVGLTATARHTVELDYWYGPKFTDDLSSIQAGVTVHGANDDQRLFQQISRTEFWWQRRVKGREAELILEAEEVRDSECGADRSKLRCRYVHSVINEATQRIEHLDGSIRAYTQEEMLARLDVDLKEAGRNTEYTKLWRVDGKIEFGRWKSAIHNHFRENTLVSEYFGTVKSEEDVRLELEKTDVFPRSLGIDPRVAWRCDHPSSFRVLVTRQPPIQASEANGRLACAYTAVEFEDATYSLFDLRALELKKVLEQHGHSLLFPANARFLHFEDDYWQLPVVLHRTHEDVEHTIAAYRLLLSRVAEHRRSAPVLVNVSFALPDITLATSLFGRCSDVLAWLNRPQPFPTEANGEGWVREATEAISVFGEGVDFGLRFIQPGSLNLYPKRVIVRDDSNVDAAGNVMSTEVAGVAIREASRVVSATCSICHQDYLNCPCSHMAQAQKPPATELEFAFRYWAPFGDSSL